MIAVVGAGAAGLTCAIFLARRLGGSRVLALDGAPRLGAKILASGGSRCNLTNAHVTERDFSGGSLPFVRKVLSAFGVSETLDFFREIGVGVREEEGGKLFPETGRARTVLEALLRESARLGCRIETGFRVTSVEPAAGGFRVQGARGGEFLVERVVLAAGGESFPKTGSDGSGFTLARSLGHTIVPTTPALVPLVLGEGIHRDLSGLSVGAELSLRRESRSPLRLTGSLLFTHFGISGPVVLDTSRHLLHEASSTKLLLSVLPGMDFDAAERWLVEEARRGGGTRVASFLAKRLPERLSQALLAHSKVQPETLVARLGRDERRTLVRSLVEHELDVVGSRGFDHAEVTAGGVCLAEVSPRTLESRIRPGLHFAGEIVDVDGRLGGFNFQWAWSSAWVAARGATQS